MMLTNKKQNTAGNYSFQYSTFIHHVHFRSRSCSRDARV